MLQGVDLPNLNVKLVPTLTYPAARAGEDHGMLDILVFDHQGLTVWILHKFYFSDVLVD